MHKYVFFLVIYMSDTLTLADIVKEEEKFSIVMTHVHI
jgi:hypothetical protein